MGVSARFSGPTPSRRHCGRPQLGAQWAHGARITDARRRALRDAGGRVSGPDDDELLFADEGPDASAEAPAAQAPWVVLLVDDDPAVHMVSRLVFSPMRVDDRPLELLVTNSGEEGRKVLESRNDIAVAILDVVMETEEAGLNLARWIRTQSALNLTRIVLRTGQPGNAPEEEVLRLYDINDYWPKAELTAARARTLLTGQIRSFRDLQTIARQRADLETVLRSMSRLAEARGVDGMTRDIFEQVSMLLGGHTPPMWLYDLVSVSAAPRDTWHAFGTSAAGAELACVVAGRVRDCGAPWWSGARCCLSFFFRQDGAEH